ncbi:uncharacterized protein LOC114758415 [Neltuma alba]|uniref:uncharacterized protein LOC114758415 n=1 Tax=Neltuma alba TaxID=207710 RepID=UPI0010A3D100|nr:uncharacterized protein LOC114758415 [Prosopis alba]
MLHKEWDVKTQHVRRDNNKAADYLDKEGLTVLCGLHVVTSTPTALLAIIEVDREVLCNYGGLMESFPFYPKNKKKKLKADVYNYLWDGSTNFSGHMSYNNNLITYCQETVNKAKELEVEQLLKRLNKPAVRSIKMRPTFYPKRSNFSQSNPIAQLWHQSGNCPKGTIPIRRTTKDDVLREDSIRQFGKKINQTIPDLSGSLYSSNDHEYAIADLRGDRYYGAQASINIWKPHVQESNEFSLSQIWIVNRDDSNKVETIESGWQSDSYDRTGCYNLGYSGFVQVDNKVAVGGSLQPFSVYGGSQYAFSILIWKDPRSGNWWMLLGNSIFVGYWPASLFNHMSGSASNVQWGGEIVNRRSYGQHTTTGMGSGYVPQAGFGKASFHKDVSTVNRNNHLVSPSNFDTYASNAKCYDITPFGHSNDWVAYFFYGGPGRNRDCLKKNYMRSLKSLNLSSCVKGIKKGIVA